MKKLYTWLTLVSLFVLAFPKLASADNIYVTSGEVVVADVPDFYIVSGSGVLIINQTVSQPTINAIEGGTVRFVGNAQYNGPIFAVWLGVIETQHPGGINFSGSYGCFGNDAGRMFEQYYFHAVYTGTQPQETGAGMDHCASLTLASSSTLTVTEESVLTGTVFLKSGSLQSSASHLVWLWAWLDGLAYIDDFSPGYTGTISGIIKWTPYADAGLTLRVPPVAIRAMSDVVPCTRIRTFSEATNSWGPVLSCNTQTNNTGANALRSYMVDYPSFNEYHFVGVSRSGTVTTRLVRTNPAPTGVAVGWNAIGNPYPSPISWPKVMAISGNLATAPSNYTNGATIGAAYVYNTLTRQYGTINAAGVTTGGVTNIIAAGQGFLVRRATVDPNPAILTFNNSCRVASSARNTFREAAPAQDQLVRLTLTGAGSEDELLAYVDANAKDGEDNLDAVKLPSHEANVASFYSLDAEGQQLSINALPAATGNRIIALGVNAATAGQYTIALKELNNVAPGTVAMLEDAKLGRFINMSENASYTIDLEGTTNSRFRLHLVNGAAASSKNALATAFAADGQVKVVFTDANVKDATITVINSLGQVVATANKAEGNTTSLNLTAPMGVYMVQVAAPGQTAVTTRVLFNQR